MVWFMWIKKIVRLLTSRCVVGLCERESTGVSI